MKKDQLSQEIENRFTEEASKIVDTDSEQENNGKYVRIIISLIMSIVILGSLLYTLVTSLR
ncbi:hypothetical protein ACYSNW_10160 [Enterococcus sp. LJL99]